MYVGQTKQFLEVQSKKLTTQHNMATSRSQMCMGAKLPYPMESTTVTNTPRDDSIKQFSTQLKDM